MGGAMSIVLAGSTSGTITLQEPAVAGTNTITLPALTGTVVVSGQNSAITAGTEVATTSGTSIDFTGIPSWVKRITIMVSGVSTNSSNNFLIQIGSGSVTTTGYLTVSGSINGSTASSQTNTTAIAYWGVLSASSAHYGNVVLTTLGSNKWVASWSIGQGSTTFSSFGGGGITLGGTLDRFRITTSGGDTFDAGSINILYE